MIPLTPEFPPLLVWLEDMGVRTFELGHDPSNSKPDLDSLRSSTNRARNSIERAWLRWCIERGWFDYSPRDATVILYAGTANEFVRPLGGTAFQHALLHVDVDANTARLEAPLNRMIWLG